MTCHPVKVGALPEDLRREVSVDDRGRVDHPLAEVREVVFRRSIAAREPLRESGELGVMAKRNSDRSAPGGGDGDAAGHLPLPTATFHILLALRTGERHGYAIVGEVERLSEGAVRLGAGTLYGAIKRLLADGLIEESEERPDPALDDARRRYYRLTALGARVCAAELRRLETLLARAGALRPAPGAGGA